MSIYKQRLFITLLVVFSITAAFGQSGNEVIDYTTIIKAEKGKLVEEKFYLIQINNKQSDWISDISIPYSGEKLEILEASILDVHGNVLRTLKKKEIITRSAISRGTFFEDSFTKEFALKWHEYPYRVRYSYRTTINQYLYVARWYPIIDSNVPTRKASLSVQIPLDYKVNLDFQEAFTYSADTLGNSCTLQWKISNVSPLSKEIFSPPFQESIPHVTIIPKEFTYGVNGSSESWASFGAWVNQLNQGLDLLLLSEQAVVDKLIAGVTDKKEITKILYHHLQDHTRYINVSIDLGGLKPYPASYVCTNKYGDCKALTIYMKALLKYAGIESFYTLVHAESNPVKIKPKLPGQQFNHVILSVPIAGDTLWLENTASHLPYNYLGTFTQNRPALMVSNSSKLVKTPSLGLEDVLEKTTYNYTLNQDGEGTLAVAQDLRGDEFEYYRYFHHQRSEKEQLEAIKKGIKIKNYELLNWKIADNDRDFPQINLQLGLHVTNQLRRLGKSLVISPNPFELPKLQSADNRKELVRISYPLNKVDSITYQLDFISQYQTKLPQNISIESKYGQYLEHFQLTNNQLHITRSFQLFAGEYSKEEYPHFYAFIESVKESQKKSVIVLNPR